MVQNVEPFCSNPHCRHHKTLVEPHITFIQEGSSTIDRLRYIRTSPALKAVTFYLCDQCNKTFIWLKRAEEGNVD